MIQARRIGHITLETPDLQRQVDYFTQVMGLVLIAQEQDRAFLGTKVGYLTMQLIRADAARCVRQAFEVAPDTDFASMARRLSAEGISSELRSDCGPGLSQVLAFSDLKGTEIEIFTEWSAVGINEVNGVSPLKLGHVAFQVTDVQATADFYSRVLGFRVSDWIDDYFVFMRCNPDHHTVNFIKGPVSTMHHMAYELKDWAQIQSACDFLSLQNVKLVWGPLRHGPGHNIAVYFHDRDGQTVETYCELDQMKDEALGYFEPRPWHRDRPQRPKTWIGRGSGTIWGPPPPPRPQ